MLLLACQYRLRPQPEHFADDAWCWLCLLLPLQIQTQAALSPINSNQQPLILQQRELRVSITDCGRFAPPSPPPAPPPPPP